MTLVRLRPSHSFVSFLYARRKCTYRSYNLHWMPHGDWWKKGYLVRFHDMFCSIWKYQRHQNQTTNKIILWFCHPSFTHTLPCVSCFFSFLFFFFFCFKIISEKNKYNHFFIILFSSQMLRCQIVNGKQ